jgi:hypothetical protein
MPAAVTAVAFLVTLADDPAATVAMNATLQVQDGPLNQDKHAYQYYAGPVTTYAPNSCAQWAGAYQSSAWTSAHGHCD